MLGRLPNSGRSLTLSRQDPGAESGIEKGKESEIMLLGVHNLHMVCQKLTLLCILPARQAESRMVESHGQANGHCTRGQVITRGSEGLIGREWLENVVS